MKDQILDSHSKFIGDSEPGMREKVEAFSSRFSKFLSLEEPFSIVFDDPAGNSYVQVRFIFILVSFAARPVAKF